MDAVYLDFAKAFDSVPHVQLLWKFESYRVSGKLLLWNADFLSKRCQWVCLDGSVSAWLPVSSGVPQGSVLGPVLFLVYINDLQSTAVSRLYLYADDTKMFRRIVSMNDCQVLQADLDVLCEWSRKWQLNFNVKKCLVIQFGCGNIESSYTMNVIGLESISVVKDLGVMLDK